MASSFLRSRGKSRWAQLTFITVLVGLLGACEAQGSEPVAVLSPVSSGTTAPQPDRDRLRALDLVRAGTILAEHTARGVAEPAEFETDGSYAFRAVCSGGGTMKVRTHASRENDVAVACDGFTSGMRYLTDLDLEVWSVDATDDQRWSIVWVDWDGRRN